MKAAAAALCLAVTGTDRPSGSPNEPPGPVTPGTSAICASPAMFDWLGSLGGGMLPGPVASRMAFSPPVNLLRVMSSLSDTEPGETQPFLTASTSHCSALYPAEPAWSKDGLKFSSNSCPPVARGSRDHG